MVTHTVFTPARENLGQQVYQHLRDRIYLMDIAPGARLSVSEIAEQLHVSRSPVRDALMMLVKEGVVEMNSTTGYRVIELTRAYIQNVFVLRRALELAAIPLAMAHLDRQKIEQLRAQWLAFQSVENATPRLLEDEIRADQQLHRTIAEMSKNPLLIDALDHINSVTWLISRLTYASAQQVHYGPLTVKEHLRLLEAILSDDEQAAVTALDDHLASAFARTLERLDFAKDA
jgi:DNA-binding GntR family transcriptional regulator